MYRLRYKTVVPAVCAYRTYLTHTGLEISRYVPHAQVKVQNTVDVPQRTQCLPSGFAVAKGASWIDAANSVVLRLAQTGHDQKYLYM